MSKRLLALSLVATAALAACLGTVEIGGTVTGLPTGATVTLQNNGDESLVVSADGSFTFGAPIGDGESYNVTVLTQPAGATCTVASGSGTAASGTTSITTVAVTCATTSTLVGTLTGLGSGASLVLTNATSSPTTLTVFADGAWAFPGTLSVGTTYTVSVSSQPANGKTCSVTSGATGTVAANVATAVVVACV
jgi:hypothetical protein